MSKRFVTFGLLAAATSGGCSPKDAAAVEARSHKETAIMQPLACAAVTPPTAPKNLGNPGARRVANQGLSFLTQGAKAWTAEHKCFGCHVQAVTMEALTFGLHHQYDVGSKDLESMVDALKLGVTAGGRVTGAAFQGQAWARYDAWIDGKHTAELMQYTNELATLQREDGSIPDDDARRPITGGTMQTTYQAMQTWRQAFARTADDKWLTPMRKAERYLATQSNGWTVPATVYIQDINFALLGLVAAGVSPGEPSSQKLQKLLLERQNQDGGWGVDPKTSDALATGQTLYALRLAGHGDGESSVDRGTAWLVKQQQANGSFGTIAQSQGGAEKGAAMWAVLGLVATDVTSVAVNGLVDGQHVASTMPIEVNARDNQAGGVSKIEMFVDDQPIAGACADTLAYTWKTDGLAAGKHTVDVVATNTKLQTSRRRYEVYAGNIYLTDLGTRYDEAKQATEIAIRNIAGTRETAGKVELSVYATKGANNTRADKVFGSEQPGTPGPMTFAWNGFGTDGKAQPRGRYIVELAFRDATNKVIQKTETLVLQDSEAAQRANYGEIEGQLSQDEAAPGAATSANTEVELVDKEGNVVQRMRSTEQGNWRFKNVSKGDYKVRVSKSGFAKQELDVTSTPAAKPSKADMKMVKKK